MHAKPEPFTEVHLSARVKKSHASVVLGHDVAVEVPPLPLHVWGEGGHCGVMSAGTCRIDISLLAAARSL
jgi:hypothetical protein